jgi:hypothetical protein
MGDEDKQEYWKPNKNKRYFFVGNNVNAPAGLLFAG